LSGFVGRQDRTGACFAVIAKELKFHEQRPTQVEKERKTMKDKCNHQTVEAGSICPHCGEKVNYMLWEGSRKATPSDAREAGRKAAENLSEAFKANPEFFSKQWKPIKPLKKWNEVINDPFPDLCKPEKEAGGLESLQRYSLCYGCIEGDPSGEYLNYQEVKSFVDALSK